MRNTLLITVIFFSLHASAQNNIGLNPPSLKWNQIQTPTGRIIFPKGLDSIAFRAAGIMNYERIHDSSIIATGKTKAIPAIIQNQSTLPAGFSTPAPWRNEYYIASPQNLFLGPVPWLDAMVAHEYRHTQQFYVGHGGFTWAYKILMGQTGWLFNSLITQPLWLREGDAVVSETINTKGGRGRLPSFHMEYRALRLSGDKFNYEKAHYTSLKDFVPNAYRIGYYMTTKARKDFGDDVWQKIYFDAFHKKGFIYPLSRSMQKYTGMGVKQFYNATVKELDSIFLVTDKTLQLTAAKAITDTVTPYFTSYHFPHYESDTSIITLKSSFEEIKTYYRITQSGKQERLFSPGVYTDDHITTVAEGNLMTWCESSFHERWINVDYSVIKVYDLKTGKTRKLTSRSKYFSPAPSYDGTKIITVRFDEMGKCNLVILDAKNGEVIKVLSNPDNVFYSLPRWMEGDERIVAIALTGQGNSIVSIDASNGVQEIMVPYTDVSLSHPFHKGEYIFFSGGYSGINNIYALLIPTKRIYQVTSVRFGAFEPHVSSDGKRLVYSEYTADGYQLKEVNLTSSLLKPMAPEVSSDIKFHEPLLKHEGKDLSLASFPGNYEVKKYHALTDGLFNIYGGIPLPNIPEYGAEFYTQNIMSSLRGTIGILYNTNENNLHSYIRLTYAALYPVIDVQYEYGLSRDGKNFDSVSFTVHDIEWTENFVSAGMTFPLRLTQGTHFTTLSLGGFYQYYNVNSLDTTNEVDIEEQTFFHAINPVLQFSRLKVQARRHVKPRWGQTLTLSAQHALNDEPQRYVAVSRIFFPGVLPTHSLNFVLSWKKEEVMNTYRFRDDFIMPRGYEPTPFEAQYGFYCNYEFPLWYPDISAGPVAFFQRLRLNVFYDYTIGSLNDTDHNLNSAGGELYFDFRLFRLFQVSAAVRYSYPFNDDFEKTNPVQFLVTRFEFAN